MHALAVDERYAEAMANIRHRASFEAMIAKSQEHIAFVNQNSELQGGDPYSAHLSNLEREAEFSHLLRRFLP